MAAAKPSLRGQPAGAWWLVLHSGGAAVIDALTSCCPYTPTATLSSLPLWVPPQVARQRVHRAATAAAVPLSSTGFFGKTAIWS